MKESDICIGAVAYLDVGILNRDPHVSKVGSEVPRNGPFVCVRIVGRSGLWTALVGRKHTCGRLEILPEWRLSGTDMWRANPDCYLGDGANTYFGPHAVFVRAAHGDLYYIQRRYTPPKITMEGVRAILAVVEKRGGGGHASLPKQPLDK